MPIAAVTAVPMVQATTTLRSAASLSIRFTARSTIAAYTATTHHFMAERAGDSDRATAGRIDNR
jgi:hypothetical protein